ncbi:MAG: VOC family protein [Pseudomonadales bacterium]|nr:VOC family protein [Pseudomonadales bacterium]
MIGYTTIGVNDLAKAEAFYTELFKDLGASKIMDMDRMKIFGTGMGAPMFAICTPYDGKPASAGNGTMIALGVTKEQAAAMHAKALSMGATDEGAPGERGPGFYGAYIRDPDGNKLCFFQMG